MLPSIVQTTDSFNTWFDATNNVISHLANTSVFLLLSQNATPSVAQGNAAFGNVVTIPTLVVNTSANVAGTTVNVSANLNHTGTTATFTSNVVVSAATLQVGGNTTLAGAFVNVATGRLQVTGNVTFSNSMVLVGNATFSNTVSVTGAATFNSTVLVSGVLTANGSGVTSINASALATGTVPSGRLSGTYSDMTANNATYAFGKSEGALNVNSATSATTAASATAATTATTANNATYAFGKTEGALNVNSAATATQATNATSLNSQPGSYYTNASNLNTGTVGAARLPAANSTANGAITTSAQTFAGAKTFDGSVTANALVVVTGSSLTANGSVGTAGQVLVSNGTSPYWTTLAGVGTTTEVLTFASDGTGNTAGNSFNGSVAKTISYNSVGAPKADGTGASGTWSISISGSAGSVGQSLTFATSGGAAAGNTFNGSAAKTISYNSIGALAANGVNAINAGEWAIDISGSASTLEGKTEANLNVNSAAYASNAGLLGGTAAASLSVAYAANAGLLGGTAAASLSVAYAADAGLLGGSAASALSVAYADEAGAITSDGRLKTVIDTIDDPLTRVAQLRGVRFTWNEDGLAYVFPRPRANMDAVQLGLIAQDVQLALPEAVQDGRIVNDKGYLAVDYAKVIPLLVEAVKALADKVATLESGS